MPATWFPPLGRRPLLVFGTLVIALLAPWPGWGRGFCALFSAYGNGLVALEAPSGAPPPRFSVPAPGEVGAADGGDWAVVLTSGERVFPLDTRIIAYTPLAIFLALALATPVPRRRKVVILAGGLAVLLARLAFAVLVPIGRAFGGARPGAVSASLAEIAWTVLVTPPVMSYAAPLAAWWGAVALTTSRGKPQPNAARSPGRLRRPGR